MDFNAKVENVPSQIGIAKMRSVRLRERHGRRTVKSSSFAVGRDIGTMFLEFTI